MAQKYPDIILKSAVIVQPAITADSIHVVQIAENPDEKWVNAFVSDGVKQFWVSILNSDTYFSEWSDVDVMSGVLNYVSENYSVVA